MNGIFVAKVKHSLALMWQHNHEILLFCILCVALLLRINSFHSISYAWQSDYDRDYLIAHHIVAYHELPLTGPDGEFGSAGNSPAYFYFLALPLLLKDDIVFLGVFNVLLQMAALVLVYMLARSMFGKSVGLAASVLFGLSQSIVAQSDFVWQPWIMQPFFLLSLLLLYRAYSHQQYRSLLFSISIFLFSATLHQSVYAFIPMYVLSIVFILWKQQKPRVYYWDTIATFFGTFFLLHAPLFFYFWRNKDSLPSFSNSSHSFLTVHPGELANNLSVRMKIFFDFFFVHNSFISLSVFLLLGFFVIASIAYFCYARRKKEQKCFMFVLIMAMAQFFLIAILVSISPLIPFPVRYFTPLFGIMIIYIAELAVGSFPKAPLFIFVKIPLVFLLIVALSPHIADYLASTANNLATDPKEFFSLAYVRPPFIFAVEKEIYAIQEIEQRRDFYFFGVQTFRFGRDDPFSNEIFWASFERDLKVPLITVLNDAQRDYQPRGDPLYLFLSCGQTSDAEKECFVPFLIQFPRYHIQKKIYEYPSIYLARREAP